MQSRVIKQSRDTIPLMTECICAGFPSPAQDYMETDINLHDYLIPHPLSTFLLKVVNDSMEPLIPANKSQSLILQQYFQKKKYRYYATITSEIFGQEKVKE
jgi:hypothetical protein